jgi:hypothetical protein
MFCPNCGTKTEAGQKYCRACGLSVEKLAGLISEQLPAGALAGSTPEEVARLLRRKRKVERLLVGLGVTGGVGLVLAIMAAVIFGVIIGKGEPVKGGIILAFIVLGVIALALVFYRDSLTDSLTARGVSDEKPKKLEGGAATSKLLPEPHFEPIPSVTDRTTELLAAEPKRTTKEV